MAIIKMGRRTLVNGKMQDSVLLLAVLLSFLRILIDTIENGLPIARLEELGKGGVRHGHGHIQSQPKI